MVNSTYNLYVQHKSDNRFVLRWEEKWRVTNDFRARTDEWLTCQWNCTSPWLQDPFTGHSWILGWALFSTPEDIWQVGTSHTNQNGWMTCLPAWLPQPQEICFPQAHTTVQPLSPEISPATGNLGHLILNQRQNSNQEIEHQFSKDKHRHQHLNLLSSHIQIQMPKYQHKNMNNNPAILRLQDLTITTQLKHQKTVLKITMKMIDVFKEEMKKKVSLKNVRKRQSKNLWK